MSLVNLVKNLSLALTLSAIPSQIGKEKLNYESIDLITNKNIIMIRANKNTDHNGSLANFENYAEINERNFRTLLEKTQKIGRLNFKQKVNFETYEIQGPDTIIIRDSETLQSVRDNVRNQIDSVLTDFYKRNGQINFAYITAHGIKNSALSLFHIKYQKNKNQKVEIRRTFLTAKQIKEIANENTYAQRIFHNDAELIIRGCNAGSPHVKKSLAQAFADEYNVMVYAPEDLYIGGLTWGNANKHPQKFPSLTSKINNNSIKQASVYLAPDTRTVIHVNNNNRLFYINCNKPKERRNLAEIGINTKCSEEVRKELEEIGYELIKKERISYFMSVATFIPTRRYQTQINMINHTNRIKASYLSRISPHK